MAFVLEDDPTFAPGAQPYRVPQDIGRRSGGFVLEDEPPAPKQSITDKLVSAVNAGANSDFAQASKTVGIRGAASAAMWPADLASLAKMAMERLMAVPKRDPEQFSKADTSKMSALQIAGRAQSMGARASAYPGTSQDLANVAFQRTPEYKAKTEPGKLAMAGATGATAAVLSAPSFLSGLTGFTSGVAGQGASDAFPKTWWAGPLASLLAGGATLAGYSALRPSRAGVARDILEDARNDTGTAGGLQRDARSLQLGPLTAPESLNSPYGLSVQRLVEQSREGRGTRGVMQNRGGLASTAADKFVSSIAPGTDPRQGAAAVQESAKAAVKTATGERSAQTSPYYQAAEIQTFGQDKLDPLFRLIDDQVARKGAATDAGKALIELKGKLNKSIGPMGAEVGPIEQLYKEFRDSLESDPIKNANSLKGANRTAGGALGEVSTELGSIIKNNNQNIATGRAIHQAETPKVDEISKGLTGDLAAEQNLSTAAQVFINPKNERPHNITQAAAALEREKPGSAASLVMQYLKDKLEAAKMAVTGDPSRVGSNFNARTMGAEELNTQQAQNIEAAMRALPNGDQLLQGFRKMTNVFRAQGNRYVPGSPTAYNAAIAEQLADPSGFGKLGQLAANPPRTVFQSIQNMRLRHTYEALDAVFSSPDSIGALQKLAREPNFRRQQAIVSTFVGGRGVQPAPQ